MMNIALDVSIASIEDLHILTTLAQRKINNKENRAFYEIEDVKQHVTAQIFPQPFDQDG